MFRLLQAARICTAKQNRAGAVTPPIAEEAVPDRVELAKAKARERSRKWYQDHKEEAKQKNLEWRKTERGRAYTKAYMAAYQRSEKWRAYKREWQRRKRAEEKKIAKKFAE